LKEKLKALVAVISMDQLSLEDSGKLMAALLTEAKQGFGPPQNKSEMISPPIIKITLNHLNFK
jgi:hypothetical protein